MKVQNTLNFFLKFWGDIIQHVHLLSVNPEVAVKAQEAPVSYLINLFPNISFFFPSFFSAKRNLFWFGKKKTEPCKNITLQLHKKENCTMYFFFYS